MLKLRFAKPPALIDIGAIAELKMITVYSGTVRIGALATHWEIASSHDVKHACSMLSEVAGGIGDPQVRNRGTIGGNVVHSDPASDWPAVLPALNARFMIQGPGGSSRNATIELPPVSEGVGEIAMSIPTATSTFMTMV